MPLLSSPGEGGGGGEKLGGRKKKKNLPIKPVWGSCFFFLLPRNINIPKNPPPPPPRGGGGGGKYQSGQQI